LRVQLGWLWAVLGASLRADTTFRTSWLLDVFSRLSLFAITVVFFDLLYGHRYSLGGVPWPQMLVLLGTYQCVRTLSEAVFAEVNNLPIKVEKGTLDFDLLKPVGSRLLASVGRIKITRLLELGPALTVVLVGAGREGMFINWLSFALLVLVGAWLKYCLTFVLNCAAFWVVQTYGLYGLFDQVFDLARYPLTVLKGFVRIILTYVLPVALVANLPVLALMHKPFTHLIAVAAIHSILWYLLGSLAWRYALERYTGASA